MRMLRLYVRGLGWLVKIMCLVMTLGFPLAPFYDHLQPWPPALEALARYGTQTRLCVGYGSGSSSRRVHGEEIHESYVQRAFILFPAALSSPQIISVTQDHRGNVTVEESTFGFWFLVVFYLVCLWGTWRFWGRGWFGQTGHEGARVST